MKYTKVLLISLLALLMLGAFSAAVAQDQLPAVQLTQWTTEQEEAKQKAMADLFAQWAEKFSPGSTLEIVYKETETQRNDLQTAALAGSGLPDMVLGPNDPIGIYVESGILQPLDELFDLSPYLGLDAAQLDGQTYGIPFTIGNHLMLLYNKQFVETAPDTWEELIATAKAVEEANPGVRGLTYHLAEPFWFLAFVHGFGGSTFDAEGNFAMDTQAWIDAYQFVQDLKYVEKILPEECDYACLDGLFKEGSVAMIFNGDWSIGDYLDTEKSPALGPDNLGIAPWPKLPNGERPKPFTSGRYASIPVTVADDKLAATVSFLTWLTTDEAAVKAMTLDFARLPAVDYVQSDDPVLAASAAVVATGVGMPADPLLRCMWDSVRPNLEGVMSNTITPADAAAEAQLSAEECAES